MRLETLKFGSELEVKDSDIFIDYNTVPPQNLDNLTYDH